VNLEEQFKKLYPVEILSNKLLTKGIYLLSFPRMFDFKAGQVIGITIDKDFRPRLYSIASGPKDKHIKILFNIKAGGEMTPLLADLQKGEIIYISEPFGSFTGTRDHAYWIAAGTGIAPFSSMFYDGQGENKILIHGGKTSDSFYFQEDFCQEMGKTYVRCSSQEKIVDVYNGRLTAYLNDQESFPSDMNYYLCGSPEMVVQTRDILISKGVPFERVIAEIFF
jgi:ferredoxin--NADP+ reductase